MSFRHSTNSEIGSSTHWAQRAATALVLGLFGCAFALLLLELFARAYFCINPATSGAYQDYLISDDTLHYRMMPNALDHDANGWRNPAVLDRVSIVVLGDSMTWGNNVSRDKSWPQVLAQLSGETVYSLALPGYGPADYYSLLMQDGLNLSPNRVIVGLYFGNDLVDASSRVYQKDAYTPLRSAAIDRRELDESFDTILRIGAQEHQVWRPQVIDQPRSWATVLRQSTSTGRLLHRFNLLPQPSGVSPAELYAALAPDDPHRLDTYFTVSQHLYFYPFMRQQVLDPEHLAVQEGTRLTRHFIREMQSAAQEHNARLIVVLIPTKELVYAKLAEAQHGRLSAAYTAMIDLERAARQDMMAFLAGLGVPVIDGLIPLQQAAEQGRVIYPPVDGHPDAVGYRLLAETIAAELATLESH